jgi:cell division protein FtsW
MQRRFVFFNVFLLVIAVVVLITLGIVLLTSTGAYAQEAKGDQFRFLKNQLQWLCVGVAVCVGAAVVNYRHLEKRWWWLYLLAAVLLVLCFVPGIGKDLNGAKRWIRLGGQTFQPSEMGKLAALVTLAWWYSRKETDPKAFFSGFVYPLLGVGVIIGLIVPEVDLGTSALIGCATLLVMFVAGTRLTYLIMLAASGAGALYAAIQMMPERAGRFLAFLYPDRYPEDAYQQLQGLIALGAGGVWGTGLGNGRQKLLYLPYAHTDFIFPMIGEEMGLVCTLAVVICFLILLVAGVVIATRASDRFGKLLGFGLVALLSLQAIINMGVTTMLLPNKGLPLPFISYGGSNMVFCLTAIGILISIYRRGYGEQRNPEAAFFEVKGKKKRKKAPRI